MEKFTIENLPQKIYTRFKNQNLMDPEQIEYYLSPEETKFFSFLSYDEKELIMYKVNELNDL